MEGKRDAQKLLFDRYAGKMLSICKRYFDNTEEAEDALQEGFIKVFEKLHQWQGSGALGGWIRTVMINTALTHLRSSKKWKDSTDLEAAEDLTSDDMDALASMNADELLQLIASMPSGYRTVFNLFALEGYAHKEIAEMLGVSENTSKTQYLKSKDWLKKNLLKQEKEIERSE
jgi:RNA polymerase sigma-70 factor (ECF subfamily)